MTNKIRELSMDELETVSGGALDGISYLIAVTQMKVDNANNNAMAGADAQRQSLHPHRVAGIGAGIR
jgi:hypothetical protein